MKKFALAMALSLFATAPAFADPLDGVWSGESQMRQGPQMITLDIKVSDGKLTGTFKQAEHPAAPIDGTVDGTKLRFDQSFDFPGHHVVMKWAGELKSDALMMTRDVLVADDPSATPPPQLQVMLTRMK